LLSLYFLPDCHDVFRLLLLEQVPDQMVLQIAAFKSLLVERAGSLQTLDRVIIPEVKQRDFFLGHLGLAQSVRLD